MVSYNQLLARIIRWARNHSIVQSIVMVGSRARSEEDIDHYSDLDLIIFTDDQHKLTATKTWLDNLGIPWVANLNTTSAGDPEWIVIFENGIKADFVLIEADQISPDKLLYNSPYQDVLKRGWNIVYGKNEFKDEFKFEIEKAGTNCSYQAVKLHTEKVCCNTGA